MSKIRMQTLAQFCRRVGLSLRAGVDIRKIWEIESNRGSPAHRRIIGEVKDKILEGESLARALRETDGYFPSLAVELIDVGESTGRLEAVLLKLADHYDHLIALRRSFLQIISWPALQLMMGIGVIGFLILILGMIGARQGVPATTVFGLAGPQGLVIYLSFICSIASVLFLAVLGLIKGWYGDWPVRAIIRIPVVGTCLQTMALARLTWSLSTALESGTDALRSMDMALKSAELHYYSKHRDEILAALRDGQEFHASLRVPGVFPEEFLDSLETAELAGTQTESLLALSAEYQQRAEQSSRLLAAGTAYFLWGLVIVLFVFTIINLVYSLYIKNIYDTLDMLNNP